MAKHKGRRQILLPPPAAPKDDTGMSWTNLLGSLVIAAVVGVGLVTIGSWVEVRMRPPPGWVCLNVERVTADGRQHGSRCGPALGWHIERWENVGDVAVPNGVEWRRHFVSD
jgi:hypothetical protein